MAAKEEMAAMDRDQRETANRLFAKATALLEDAVEIAVAGQSPHLAETACRTAASQLQAAAADVATMASAALVLVRGRDSPNRR